MIALSLEEQDEYKKNWLHRIEFFDQQAYLKASIVIGEVLIKDILPQKVCGKKVDTSSRSVLSGLICFANSKGIFFFIINLLVILLSYYTVSHYILLSHFNYSKSY